MFRFFLVLVFSCTLVTMQCQVVSNVLVSQEQNNILVSYDLLVATPCSISLQVSENGGSTWSLALKEVKGDVGKNIPSGSHTITWFVLDEYNELRGNNIKFKVTASGNNVTIEWASIPAGTFTMGSRSTEVDRYNNEAQHQVSLSGFKMSKYEVTFDQYDAFCEATKRAKPADAGWGRGKLPVINVSWDDASAFATWMGYRLPTEAQWEYACRAGSSTPFNTGNSLSTSQANYNGNKTKEVGSFAPNAWGLYDMHGNVWEWCSDWYGNYPSAAQTNPTGPSGGSNRVGRGGSWFRSVYSCRAADRGSDFRGFRDYDIGFRLVCPE